MRVHEAVSAVSATRPCIHGMRVRHAMGHGADMRTTGGRHTGSRRAACVPGLARRWQREHVRPADAMQGRNTTPRRAAHAHTPPLGPPHCLGEW